MKEINGIIIAIRDYREYDAILQVLTMDGVINVVAKGIRKMKSKNAAACQLFHEVSMQCHAKNEYATMVTLRSVSSICQYRLIREDLLKQAIALLFCEAAAILKEEFLYDLVKGSLQLLETAQKPYACAALFLAQLIHIQGIDPNVDECVRCGNQKVNGISFRDGGFICANCMQIQDHVLSSTVLRKFRLLQKAQLEHYALLESHGDWDLYDVELQAEALHHYGAFSLHSIRFLQQIATVE